MELMPWNTTHKYKCCFSCCSFFLLRGYVTRYTTLLRMIICVMLIYDFGRKTLPATNKDPCTETHVIALKGKTEIQLTQGIFWSDACPHRHRGGSRLLWKWAHPHDSQLVKCSLGAWPGKQLTAGHRHGQRQESGLQEEGRHATSSPASRVRHPWGHYLPLLLLQGRQKPSRYNVLFPHTVISSGGGGFTGGNEAFPTSSLGSETQW